MFSLPTRAKVKEFITKESLNKHKLKEKKQPSEGGDGDHSQSTISSCPNVCSASTHSSAMNLSSSSIPSFVANGPATPSPPRPMSPPKLPDRTPTPLSLTSDLIDHPSFPHHQHSLEPTSVPKINLGVSSDKIIYVSTESLDASHDDTLTQHSKPSSYSKFKLSKWKDKAMHTSEKFIAKASEMRNLYTAGSPTPGSKKYEPSTRVFGMPLVISVMASQIDETCLLPAVVIRSIEFLEVHGMYEVGLYRVPGSSSAVSRLRSIFDDGSDLNLFDEESTLDPHAVATLLKQFLRENILNTNQNPIPHLASLARQLPQSNYYLLSWLCSHLARLAYYSDQNKMNIKNLALIFSWTLHLSLNLLTTLIENVADLFPLTDEGQIPPQDLGCPVINDPVHMDESKDLVSDSDNNDLGSEEVDHDSSAHVSATSIASDGLPTVSANISLLVRPVSPKHQDISDSVSYKDGPLKLSNHAISSDSKSSPSPASTTHQLPQLEHKNRPLPEKPQAVQTTKGNAKPYFENHENPILQASSMIRKKIMKDQTSNSRGQSMVVDSNSVQANNDPANLKHNPPKEIRPTSLIQNKSPRFVKPSNIFNGELGSPYSEPTYNNQPKARHQKHGGQKARSIDPFVDPNWQL